MIKKRLETVFTELAQLPKFIDEEKHGRAPRR